ncbi:uncharacterized protein LOC136096123 [Hydra vulgaris]|uniref:uncharacterized protein LOC136096123 n=1 Tax=Hydra vulgaris TaxID=6087 RepID=UPI0032EA2660
MDSIVRDKIMKYLNNSNLISVHQHGFMNKKKCCTNLLETLDIVSKAFDNNIPVEIIFLDFAKAFDIVPHERLCIKLASYGIIGDLLNWCKAFLKNRLPRVVLGENISEWTNVISGILQGSVLFFISVFILYINDMMLNIKNECKLYADDTKLISILDHNSSTENLQEDLNKIVQWTKN